MEDRELLKMAAKAMGVDTVWTDIDGNLYSGEPEELWNPLDDLDQAKRIRHKLHLSTGYDDRLFGPCAYATYPTGSDSCNSIMEKIHADSGKRSALRRAIVRAAAEIGKAMP